MVGVVLCRSRGAFRERREVQPWIVTPGTGFYYTPGSGEHGPRFLTGGPGAAPGGVASKNGWVYMRVQGGFNLHRLFCPYARPKVAFYSGGVNKLAYI